MDENLNSGTQRVYKHDSLSPAMQTFKDKLQTMQISEELRNYLLTIAMNVESQVNTLASFVPFNVVLDIF